MQALGCFVIICGVLVSSDSAFGFTFGVRQLESENKSDGKVAPAEDATSEVLKKVEDKIHSLKESLIRDINNQESAETDLIQNLRNSTSKSLKKADVYSEVNPVPVQSSNGVDDSEGSYSQGDGLVTNYWQPVARDLSKDTLINDRTAQQQASAGIVKIDPDAEFIDPAQHKGHIAQDSRKNFKYDRRPAVSPGADRDVEEIEPGNYNVLDQTTAPDLSRDLRVNEALYDKLEKGIYKPDPDTEFIDPAEHRGHMAQKPRVNFKANEPSGILSRFGINHGIEQVNTNRKNTNDQLSAGADLSGDILINEFAAKQVAAGLQAPNPNVEFIDQGESSKLIKNYYYVPNTEQQAPVEDLTKDTSITFESLVEPQVPAGTVMIEPYAEYTDNRRFRRPLSQDFYARNADRFQRTPQGDLSGDTAINDHISQQQSVSGLVMIDPDAELINTGANHQKNVYYYYVPNNIDQVPRMKRTEPIYQFYQRPAVTYQYPQQPIMYYY